MAIRTLPQDPPGEGTKENTKTVLEQLGKGSLRVVSVGQLKFRLQRVLSDTSRYPMPPGSAAGDLRGGPAKLVN